MNQEETEKQLWLTVSLETWGVRPFRQPAFVWCLEGVHTQICLTVTTRHPAHGEHHFSGIGHKRSGDERTEEKKNMATRRSLADEASMSLIKGCRIPVGSGIKGIAEWMMHSGHSAHRDIRA